MSYYDKTLNSRNPVARYAHRNRHRLSIDWLHHNIPLNGRYIDYGAGQGTLVSEIQSRRPDINAQGYEPHLSMSGNHGQIDNDLGSFQQNYDIISAFEVLEHLQPGEIDDFCSFSENHLATGGRIIISVPILSGPILIPKTINAIYLNRVPYRYTAKEFVNAVLDKQIERDPPGPIGLNHKGFRWKALRAQLCDRFVLDEEHKYPFDKLWWGVNSQWYGVFKLPADYRRQ